MRVHLRALGCRLNEAELEQWSRRFQQRGARVVDDPADADLMVLNTCAVTEDAVRKSRRLARRLRRAGPAAKLVISGCYASLDGRQAAADLGVDLLIDNADKDRLVELTAARFELPAAAPVGRDPVYRRHRSRAFIKVQDGCRYRCSYCIVTLARGAERSRPVADVVAEINRRHADGVSEAVLSGVHLGGYGSDLNRSLADLLRAVLRETRIPRLRLGSLEPWALGDDFFAQFADPRLLPHLHLPLQSGSDAILRRMSRRCRSGDFLTLLDRARRAIPDLNVSSDIIVGFPGESDADWQRTLEVCERAEFGALHIFPFSPRAGTKAAGLADPVDRDTRRRRVDELHALDATLRRRSAERYLGRRFPVLWEGKTQRLADGLRRRFGYTPNYLRVATELTAAQSDALRDGLIADVTLSDIVSADGDTLLIGEL